MVAQNNSSSTDLILGGVIQCLEAASLGMPFEVWKTRMGRFRSETTIESFKKIYQTQGLRAFWSGLGPKMVESATKGSILLFSKDFLRSKALEAGLSSTSAGFLGGAGGGIAQVSVMGPCTFLVTAVVTQSANKTKTSVGSIISSTWKNKGIKGFYPGGSAIAMRQATNWASRQGFTDLVRIINAKKIS